MLVKDIGEFALIERFRRQIKTDSSVVKASGDDCAVLSLDKHNYQLFTCDMIVEGVDFTRKDDARLIGRKALAISMSDIASCAGTPRHALVSMGIPRDTPLALIDKIAAGIFELAAKQRINIVGGDISSCGRLVIDISMLGVVPKKELCLRQGARQGDAIFVTGSLGGSIAGKHLKFTPRLKEAHFLARNFKIHSMIDISDGLLQDLGHILEASKTGAVLYGQRIPLSREAKGLSDALSSGEEFELLFTLSGRQAKRLSAARPGVFKEIGRITSRGKGMRLIGAGGKEEKIPLKGYRHF